MKKKFFVGKLQKFKWLVKDITCKRSLLLLIIAFFLLLLVVVVVEIVVVVVEVVVVVVEVVVVCACNEVRNYLFLRSCSSFGVLPGHAQITSFHLTMNVD